VVKDFYTLTIVAAIFAATLAWGLSSCNRGSAQIPEFDPREIWPGQVIPEKAKITLISRISTDTQVWGFKCGMRFYRVETWKDTVSYINSTTEDW
jgi:hypothetical protein